MKTIKDSELVLNASGRLYHINMTGEELADNVFLVGDPGRIEMFKQLFDSVSYEGLNREMHSLTGTYKGQRFTALSTGMGCDNIDIVMTELDAAANMNLVTRSENASHRSLNLIRIGTSGSLHADVEVGSRVVSAYAIGMDGLVHYYQHDPALLEVAMADAFVKHMHYDDVFARPYAARASEVLLNRVSEGMVVGITATAPGFYAPQGRLVRIPPALHDLNENLASFQWDGLKITNLEMETSAIYGMSRIMGHQALTVCLIIANRPTGTFLNEYHGLMKDTIVQIMDSLVE